MNALKFRTLIFLLICTQIGRAEDPLDTWTWRNPLPTGEVLWGITYGNALFAAVGEAGTILTSAEGKTWERRQSGITKGLKAIAYGNGMFVAAGDDGTILTSADNVGWAQRQSGTTNQLLGIAYGNGLFVVVGDHGTILTSTDSVRWDQRQSGTRNRLRGIAYGSGQFVAIGFGTGETILTSMDGDKWVRRHSRANWEGLTSIAYGNGLFVVVGDLLDIFPILTSADGIYWEYPGERSGYRKASAAEAVAYGAGYFVTGGFGGTWTSANGVNWVSRPMGTTWLWSIAYGNGHFVGVGYGGRIVQSGSIVTLEIAPHNASESLALSLEGPTGLDYTIQTSTDLITWRDVTKISNAQSSKVILDGLPVTSDRRFYRATSQ